MLIELFIKNFVLIKEVSINLNKGLVAFTGESGSGKSLLLSSIYYLFGGKLKDNIMMERERECVLLAKFRANKEAKDYLLTKGILVDDFIIIKRVITSKSSDTFLSNYYINNEPISSIILKPVFDMLIEIHSQNQQYLILKNPSNNLKILDNYANLNVLLEEYRLVYEKYIKLLNEYDNFISEEKLQQESKEECERIIKDIDSLNPKIGEEEILKSRLDELRNHEALCNSLLNLKNVLTLSENVSALSEIRKIIGDSEYLSRMNSNYLELENRLKSAYYELEDIGQAYSRSLLDKTYDEMEVEEVESRLYDISRLKKKYGPNVEDIIELRKRCSTIIHSSLNFETERLEREQELNNLLKRVEKLATDISGVRKRAALDFSSGVTEILHKLNMSNAEFFASITEKKMSLTGIDEVDFLISSNLGIKAQPIYRIASGGELSRIMLAIKSVQNVSEDKLVIFDEIDSGIGGEAGVSLGRYLKNLADNVQIFVVTHLANIASLADCHILIKKECSKDETYVNASLLMENDRVLEVARMLSGNINDSSIKHAEHLLKNNN
ncbi:DNA repair protein RecN [Borrelia turcica IST7]|uniref:DNA repair protein RecN n=1 Tax=Borrelia turcica IST7 TaxID=1104446 RepID=A0A386PML9_9SPIR|nr:DNA repair protein RecN [Borrelia turcica]AYE36193.1 DNA repair protein RecN [Borrelia turcica IST7]